MGKLIISCEKLRKTADSTGGKNHFPQDPARIGRFHWWKLKIIRVWERIASYSRSIIEIPDYYCNLTLVI